MGRTGGRPRARGRRPREGVHAGAREPDDVLRGGRLAGRPSPRAGVRDGGRARRAGHAPAPEPRPRAGVPGATWVAAGLTLALAVLLVAPAALHALSAVETLALAAVAPDRGGVSETVQVLAYASAPCAFVGVGVPAVTFVCGLWAFALLVLGTRTVHSTSFARACVAALAPGALAYGSGFGWFAATTALFPRAADYMPWVGRSVEAAAVLGV
ncbi:YIP1 family protein [Halobacterium sp. CBA1126]|uniref:YIP1 family protein n=1 Tax=Halobacterium sp. CBA1126 TaxID=2668074 RepID=UPI002F916ABC